MKSPEMAMIVLVGEQPAPNLLPIRHANPNVVALVYTKQTERIAQHLEGVLTPAYACQHCLVHPYRLVEIQERLIDFIDTKLEGFDLVFNLTGGTKPMSLAAFQVARSRACPFVYFQSEGGVSKVFRYAFSEDDERTVIDSEPVLIPASISLEDYLHMYLGHYTSGEPRNVLEDQVFNTLQSTNGVDEVLSSLRPQGMAALEVDFVLRCGNQIGIGEVKTQGDKKAIDQLNGVADQRYLGTYIRKFLVSARPVDGNNKELAAAYRTEVIEFLGGAETGEISAADREELQRRVLTAMGVSPSVPT